MTRAVVMLGLGYGFLALGIAGLFLPFLQGFLFIAIGLIILARYASWARRTLDWTKRQHPKADLLIGRAEASTERWRLRARDLVRRQKG